MERVTDLNYWIDGLLKSNLNSIIYNMRKDYDSVILVSGSGMVRVGKSVIAQQIGYFIASRLNTPFIKDNEIPNIVFSGKELISSAKKLPKNSVIIYDEARGELDNKKIMENITKSLLDFFAECGMYNHCLIMVLPDYFELPKSIAINRSECLINVLRIPEDAIDEEGNEVVSFERGVFEFYNRHGKKMLYILGKKNYDDYSIGKKYRSFFGDFPNFFIVNRENYEEKKLEHIQRDRGKNKEEYRFAISLKTLCNHVSQRNAQQELKEEGLSISQGRISQLITSVSVIEGQVSLDKR